MNVIKAKLNSGSTLFFDLLLFCVKFNQNCAKIKTTFFNFAANKKQKYEKNSEKKMFGDPPKFSRSPTRERALQTSQIADFRRPFIPSNLSKSLWAAAIDCSHLVEDEITNCADFKTLVS